MLKYLVQNIKYRIMVIAFLLAVSCFLTYYFHNVHGIGTVFSHFFYIPIILASIWWKRKGLLIALFLAAILIFSHIFLREDVATANDFFRSILLIVIACVVAFLSERIAKTEKKLQKTSAYLEKLFNYANAPIIVWSPDLKITRFNHAFERLTGFKANKVIGNKLQLLFPKANYNDSLKKIIHTLNGEYWETVEIPILDKSGQTRLVIWNSANIYSEDGLTHIATIAQGMDITERKQAEKALLQAKEELEDRVIERTRELSGINKSLNKEIEERKQAEEFAKSSERRWCDSFNSLEDVMLIIDKDYNIININNIGLTLLGKSREEAIGQKCYKTVYNGDKPGKFCPIIQALKTKKVESIECYIGCFDKHFSIKVSPIFDENGEITKFVNLMMDITEKKDTELELKKSEKLYRETINHLPLHLAVTNQEGKYLVWNKYSEKMLGYKAIEVLEKITLNDIMIDNYRAEEIYSEALQKGFFDKNIKLKNKNGNTLSTHLRVIPLFDQDHLFTGFIGMAEDLTLLENSKKRIASLSEELVQSQENERRRLSAELHDEASSVIVSLKYYANIIKKLLSQKKYKETSHYLDLTVDTYNKLASELRRLCYNLYPANINQTGVLYALNDYIEKIKMYSNLKINYTVSSSVEDTNVVIKTTLYRIIQEAITNVIRHSNAKKVSIALVKKDNQLKLKIFDNGDGFDLNTVDENKYGLRNIRDRVEELNGNVIIQTSEGNGTSLKIEIPDA